MNEGIHLAERFEENRAHLRAVAYRMLGSLSEVDDAVQETWPQLSRADSTSIKNLGGWLTTVVGRVCPPTGRPAELERLSVLAGKWTAKSHTYESPTGPASDAEGTGTYQWKFRGMHHEGGHDSKVAGTPHFGRTTWRWDPEQHQYQLVWVDDVTSSVSYYRGAFSGDALVLSGSSVIQGKPVTFTFPGPDAFALLIENDMSGEMKRLVEETARRVK